MSSSVFSRGGGSRIAGDLGSDTRWSASSARDTSRNVRLRRAARRRTGGWHMTAPSITMSPHPRNSLNGQPPCGLFSRNRAGDHPAGPVDSIQLADAYISDVLASRKPLDHRLDVPWTRICDDIHGRLLFVEAATLGRRTWTKHTRKIQRLAMCGPYQPEGTQPVSSGSRCAAHGGYVGAGARTVPQGAA